MKSGELWVVSFENLGTIRALGAPMKMQEDRRALRQEDRPTGPYIEALVNPS
jgi:hypothetical protein